MTYRIFGSELSPYSVKVRSYFRFKDLSHDWIPRSPAVQAEFQKYAKLPLVPLVVTPDGEGIQDSTPIIERFEAAAPALAPEDPALAFISALLEECERANGDEPITFFEVTTCAAFLEFARTPADILLLETGLGGRLDSTNVVEEPMVRKTSTMA